VIIYTSSSEPKDIDQAMRLGAFAYIVKPLSLVILGRIVRELAAAMANPDHDHGLLGWHVRPLEG
jgi:AmiR/NasT family two-component response regulator